MGLGALAVTGEGHVTEGLLVPQVLEGGYHVGLEVVPAQAELLLIVHYDLCFLELFLSNYSDFELTDG